jgi:DNA-binding MarR family transcriptional regulator
MIKKTIDTELYEVKYGEIDANTFMLFIQAADAVLKYSEAILVKAGLSLIKLRVLRLLQIHGGMLRPSEIASLTLRERHDVTTLIRRLEKGKLVRIKTNQKDRRSVYVIITRKGEQALEDATPAARNIVKQVMASIPGSKTEDLEKLLMVLRKNAYYGLTGEK